MRDGSRIDPYDDTKTAVHFIEPDGRVDSKDYPLTVGRRLRLLGRVRNRGGQRWVVLYAKPWECIDHRIKKVSGYRNRFGDSITHEQMRPAVQIDWTLVTRAQKKQKKIPGYKQHDSARAVMMYLGCSRATAFRRIKAGFPIPMGFAKANWH
jgi:hypothetical protein